MPAYQSYPPSLWTPSGSASLTTEDLTATVSIAGGAPNETYYLSWGDGSADVETTLDANGDGEESHTYALAGSYPAVVRDNNHLVVLSQIVTVTDPEPAPEDPEPEPEPEPESTEPVEAPESPPEAS